MAAVDISRRGLRPRLAGSPSHDGDIERGSEEGVSCNTQSPALVHLRARIPVELKVGLTRLGGGNTSEGIRRLWAMAHAPEKAAQRALERPLSLDELARPHLDWWAERTRWGTTSEAQDIGALEHRLARHVGSHAAKRAPQVLKWLRAAAAGGEA